MFRGVLFCECCGHPLMISKKKLDDRQEDIYVCMYHYSQPELCPKTHQVYHEMLSSYVLQQIQKLAKSMKRRRINSPIKEYVLIENLSTTIINEVIDRIEVGHLCILFCFRFMCQRSILFVQVCVLVHQMQQIKAV